MEMGCDVDRLELDLDMNDIMTRTCLFIRCQGKRNDLSMHLRVTSINMSHHAQLDEHHIQKKLR
jgi:hypothetical protein